MPQRYSSGHFAALAFFTLVAYIAYTFGSTQTLESIERREAERAARQHSVYADQHISSACGDLTGAELVVCAQEQIERSAEYQNAEYDLSAQEQMATFAKWLLWVSIASVGITGVGLFFVWKTLEQSIAATDAAQEAIEVTRKMGRLQTQAYVSFHHTMLHFLYGLEGPEALQVKIVLKNTGESPAKLVHGFCDVKFVRDASVRMDGWRGRSYLTQMNVEVGSDETRWIITEPIPIANISTALQAGLTLGVVGSVEYTDVFDGPPRRADFAVVIMFGSNPSLAVQGEPFDHDWHACQSYSAELR